MSEYYLEKIREKELQIGLSKVGFNAKIKEYGERLKGENSAKAIFAMVDSINKITDAYKALLDETEYLRNLYRESVGVEQ